MRWPWSRSEERADPFPIARHKKSLFKTFIEDVFPGGFQRGIEISQAEVSAHYAVFACETLIASDIAKLPIRLMYRASGGIWKESFNVAHPAYALLKKPNKYQTWSQFCEFWLLSKLATGQAIVWKEREGRRVWEGKYIGLHVLRPDNVQTLVSDSGDVFYEIKRDKDNLTGQSEDRLILPASEIIHDRMNCLDHPLVGMSPVLAAGLAASQGLSIQESVARFFKNSANAPLVLSVPGTISDEDAKSLQTQIHDTIRGRNIDKALILEGGLKLEQSSYRAADAQVIEQLRWTAEVACGVFHVPPWKIGLGQMPSYNNVQALNVEYHSEALQSHINAMENLLDEGLEVEAPYGIDIDVRDLMRMDSLTQMQVLKDAAEILTLDERRAELDRDPIEGGDTVYLQQQNYSVKALAKRDAQEDPFGTGSGELEVDARELRSAMVETILDLKRTIPEIFDREPK